MKHRIIFTALLVALAQTSQFCALAADKPALAAADDGFAFQLLKELAAEQPAKNIFISPYSAATVLQMVNNGAAGQTASEMRQVLGTTGLSPDAVNAGNKADAASLDHLSPEVVLTTANAIWYQRGAEVKPAFLAVNRQFFDATVEPLDFADPHAVDVINAWANEKTKGKISRIADGMIDPVYGRLFLANAVYFHGKWDDPFNREDTQNRPFHLRSGGEKATPMMSQENNFNYRRGTGYQAVRLPYEGEDLAMYVFLPDTNSSPEKLLEIMNGDRWLRVTKPGFSQTEGLLVLPKFKMEYEAELKQPLHALGMKLAFDREKADFTGMASNLYVSDARQKTFIEVKEEGTEAAAVTGIATETNGIRERPPDPFSMIVDRPFLFLIEDYRTDTILFIGLIFDPQAE
jgi:serpin B